MVRLGVVLGVFLAILVVTGAVQPLQAQPINTLPGYLKRTWPIHERGMAVRVGDLTGDNQHDVAVVTNNDRLMIWEQQPGCRELILRHDIVTWAQPIDLTLADINGDGRRDVVVLTHDQGLSIADRPSGIAIYFQTPEGGLALPPQKVTIGAYGMRVQAGDLNNDGHTDLVVSSIDLNTELGRLDIAIQDADGAFSVTQLDLDGFFSAGDVAIADMTSDGLSDIVVHSSSFVSAHAAVFPQRASGGFGPRTLVSTGVEGATYSGMAVGDITGDGRADLVTAYSYGMPEARIVYHPQRSTGGFGAPVFVDTYEYPLNPTLSDMDGDGRLDVVVLNSGYGTYTVHRQLATGGLGSAETFPARQIQSSPRTRDMDVGDVTGDGRPDVVFLSPNLGLVLIASEPTPACPTPAPPIKAQMPQFAYNGLKPADFNAQFVGLASGDFNSDGLIDFVSIFQPGVTGDVLIQPILRTMEGELKLPPGKPARDLVQLNFIAAGDLNGDERDDVAASGLNVIALSYQSSDGTLGTVQRFTPEAHAQRIFIADWNGDGRSDLGLITEMGFLIYAQQANGRLASAPQRHADIPVTAYAAPVDWNSDGRMDLALWHVDPLSAERFASLRIYLQDFEGGFTLGAANAHPSRPSDLTVGDLNSDGRPDLAVSFAASRPLGTVTIYLQDADGALGQRQVLNMDAFGLPGALVITDLNGSNGNDLLVLHSDLSSTYFTQNSAGTLDPARDWPMGSFNGSSVNSAAVADDDGDGFPDLIGLNLPVEGLLFLTPALVRDTIYLPLIQR